MDGLCLKFSGQSRTHSRPLQVEDGAMREFISKYADRIHGVLSCFDRMLFRGYLPIMSGWQMAQFFNNSNIRYRELKPFLLEHAAQVKQHGVDLAQKEGRRFQYLQEKVRKEELARQIAERDHIEDGLICVLSVLEPCRTFSFRTEKGKAVRGFRTPQVPVSVLLLHGPRLLGHGPKRILHRHPVQERLASER